MNFARILTILFLLILSGVSTKMFRSYANPTLILTLPWIFILITQQLIAPDFPFGFNAALVLTASCGCFTIGSLTLLQRRMSVQSTRAMESLAIERAPVAPALWRAFVALLAVIVIVQLALTYYYLNVAGVGQYTDGAVNPYAIYGAAGVAYGDRSLVGLAFRASVAVTYVCAGIFALDAIRRRKVNFGVFAFLAPVAGQSFLSSTKTTFLLTVSIMVVTVTAAHAHRLHRLPKKALRAIVALILLITASTGFAAMRRYGLSAEAITSTDFLDNQKVTLLGAVSNWSLFLDRTGITPDSEWTGITLAGVLGPLGFYERVSGVYVGGDAEQRLIPDSRQTTNQYTGFRLLLEDFGFGGTLVVMTALGMLVTYVFVLNTRRPSVTLVIILGNLYLLLLWLPITLLTYYAFWTIQFLVLLPIARVFFRIPTRTAPANRAGYMATGPSNGGRSVILPVIRGARSRA
ncbi:MAG: O-antigen ligase [Acidobacteria bacterium]|nr:O-antigen ligase [Acidobacteriota bacterium]